jgi:hypothetical protein
MGNSVYNTVCDALSRIVSRRAAENIVSEALRGAKTDAHRVTAKEMQALLKSAVFARLQQIIPVAQAKGEIKQILSTLEKFFDRPNPALSPEVLEGLAALQNEFRPYAKLSQPRAQGLLKSLQELPQSDDPVKALNTLWAELDLLQLELTGRTQPPPTMIADGRNLDELLLSSGEYAINYQFEDVPQENVLQGDALQGDKPLTAASTPPAARVAPVSPGSLTAVATPTAPPGASTLPAAITPTTVTVRFPLETSEGRDALLLHFALEEGVVGVLLSNRLGDVLAERLSSGEADQLAAVVAATTLLLEKRRGFQLFYTHLQDVSAFIGLVDRYVLTVLTDDRVNVGRLLSEMASLKEDI